MADQDGRGSPVERFVGVGKDVVVLLRDAALLGLAALLLLFPSSFNDLMVNAGFEEGSIVGFKWKAKLLESDGALKEAQATIAGLKAQLEKTTRALAGAQASTDDEALKSSISRLEAESRQVSASSTQVAQSVRSTIASNAALVEKAQSGVRQSGGWGVVFGSDVSLEGAQDELRRASRAGIPAASVYARNGYYASIAVTDERTTAQEVLAIAKSFRPDSYVASMATWCRDPQPRDGFTECQSRP